MTERRILNTWKEIAAYLARGVRTVQRWELLYRLPVHRPTPDVHSVYAFADELDAWLERAKPSTLPYVRPSFIVLEAITPGALSDVKLAMEVAKFNVLTAFSAAEVLATAARYDVDGFIVDSIVLEVHPSELGRELRRLYPSKPRVLLGDDPVNDFDAVLPPGDNAALVQWMIGKFGVPVVG